MVFEVAHWIGLVPLCWLAVRRSSNAAYWWLAVAYGISWLADTAAHWVDPWLIGMVYPVSQAALIGAVLLTRKQAEWFTVALMGTGLVAALEGGMGANVLVAVVAWGGICGLVIDRFGMDQLRTALLFSFGGGLVAWLAFAGSPSLMTWGLYQSVRLIGTLMFCYAVTQKPRLQLA